MSQSRRSFLKSSLATASAASLPSMFPTRSVEASAADFRSPNEVPVIGMIGTGIRFRPLATGSQIYSNCAVICDLDTRQLDKAKVELGKQKKKNSRAGEIETTDEHKELATRRVRLGLLLAELGQKAKVDVTDAEMTQAIMNQARQYPGQERQFFEFVQQNQQMQQQLRAPLFEDKVVDFVFEQAKVSEKEVSKDELQKAVEALEDE